MQDIKFATETDQRKKASAKFEDIFSNVETRIPDSIVVEQASSRVTADYVANLIPKDTVVVDLTAGLGINTFLFSKRASQVFAVEIDGNRADALRHNLSIVGIKNVNVICGNCIDWLNKSGVTFSFAYADPSRRNDKGRFFTLQDCSPDLNEILPILPHHGCHRFLVKVSPLLDITHTFKNFPNLSGITILEYQREVKELLLDFQLEAPEQKRYISCVRLYKNHFEKSDFSFDDYAFNSSIIYINSGSYMKPGAFIYEPSPAFMKAGLFGSLQALYPSILKLSSNTHLFYSTELYRNFPGRIFCIERQLSSRDLKKLRKGNFNVISRNHPANAQELTSRFQFKPSESSYLIATKIGKEKIIVLSKKI